MTKQNNSPTLRFPEFAGELRKYNLGEISSWASGGTPSKENPIYWNGNIPWITASSMRGIEYLDSENKITEEGLKNGSRLASKGNLLILVRGSMLFNKIPIGITMRDVAFNQDVKSIDVFPENSTLFILYWFISSESVILNLVTGTGIGAGKLDLADLKNLSVHLPTLPEQTKIATFLTAVDERLNQLKQKKILLEQYKKGVMQNIFDQEIRFKPDEGNEFPQWTEEKLDSIISNFIVPMRDKPKELNGEIPWCRIEDFNGKYLSSSKSGQGVSKGTVKAMNLKIYPINTLLVSCSANLGFCAIVKRELITNQTFIGLVPDENKVNVEFLFYVMILASRKLNILSSGTTISYLSRESFEKFEINLPCLAEQTRIANFLSVLDEKINGCSSQIAKTEAYKKGLLQQMFV